MAFIQKYTWTNTFNSWHITNDRVGSRLAVPHCPQNTPMGDVLHTHGSLPIFTLQPTRWSTVAGALSPTQVIFFGHIHTAVHQVVFHTFLNFKLFSKAHCFHFIFHCFTVYLPISISLCVHLLRQTYIFILGSKGSGKYFCNNQNNMQNSSTDISVWC